MKQINHPRPVDVPRQWYDKDILRVGAWRIGGRRWQVDRRLLRRLVANFNRAVAVGLQVPVVWNHSHDARDRIGSITQLTLVGDTLRARFWAAAPADIDRLGVTNHEVSVEIAQPFTDGQGNVYDVMLTHLAVVNWPVVGQQQSFRPAHPSIQKGALMSQDLVQASLATDDLGWSTTGRRLLTALVGNADASLSDGAVLDRLTQLADQLASTPQPAGPAELVQLQLELEETRRQLDLAQQQTQRIKEQSYHAALDRLVSEGRVLPADKPMLFAIGETGQFDLSLLTPFERIPVRAALPTPGIARRLAEPTPPPLADRPAMTDDRVKQILADK